MPKYNYYELPRNMTIFKILFEYHCEEPIQIEKEKHNSMAVNIRNTEQGVKML